jgi:hypothetical protein
VVTPDGPTILKEMEELWGEAKKRESLLNRLIKNHRLIKKPRHPRESEDLGGGAIGEIGTDSARPFQRKGHLVSRLRGDDAKGEVWGDDSFVMIPAQERALLLLSWVERDARDQRRYFLL